MGDTVVCPAPLNTPDQINFGGFEAFYFSARRIQAVDVGLRFIRSISLFIVTNVEPVIFRFVKFEVFVNQVNVKFGAYDLWAW